ncbi:hypothetical protein STHU_40590 [Allostella humosa]|nr:hypothetical protein STHU_40590 [Stella humosa]
MNGPAGSHTLERRRAPGDAGCFNSHFASISTAMILSCHARRREVRTHLAPAIAWLCSDDGAQIMLNWLCGKVPSIRCALLVIFAIGIFGVFIWASLTWAYLG